MNESNVIQFRPSRTSLNELRLKAEAATDRLREARQAEIEAWAEYWYCEMEVHGV